MDEPSANVDPLIKKRKKFFRCKTAPACGFSSDPMLKRTGNAFEAPAFPDAGAILHPSFKLVSFFLAVYLGIGALCFYLVGDQLRGKKTSGVVDALYLCIVTMTTVGYGDLVPNTTAAKLLACALVFAGMALVVLVLDGAAHYLVEKQEAILAESLVRLRGRRSAAVEMDRAKNRLLLTGALLLVLVALGTVFLTEVEGLDLVDAFYCVCCTVTTLGYGDKSFSTEAGRAFAVVWIITSTICLAQFFLSVTEIDTESKQRLLATRVLKRELTFFDLEAADLDADEIVSAAEFIIYKLKEMGKITPGDIAQVMEEFEDLDVDNSGTLTAADLIAR